MSTSMATNGQGTAKKKPKLALVIGNVPNVEEIDQFKLISHAFEINVIASASICDYLAATSFFNDLRCIALPDHDENPTYLPGLEKVLNGYDVVVVKERLGLYAFQAVKAKWRCGFKLVLWIDNSVAFPAEDVNQMRIIRTESTQAADAFIVQSDCVRQALTMEGIDQKKIFKFLPHVNVRVTRNHKNRLRALDVLKLKEGNFVVAHTGQIEWEEGLFDLVDAAKMAIDEDASMARRLRLVFCGIGSATEELRERLRKYGLESRATFVAPSRDALHTVYAAADCVFYSTLYHRDRLEAEPYRLLSAMSYRLPIIAVRNPLVEEFIGKHRIDFCPGSIASLKDALHKAADAKALVGNIVNKNESEVRKRFNVERVTENMTEMFTGIASATTAMTNSTIDRNVIAIEAKVMSKQYVEAVDGIEALFKQQDVPLHHRANLYRLVGDCFTKLGNPMEGKNAYAKALDLDPYNAKAHIGIGTIALLNASYDAAIMTFQKAVSLAPDDDMANLGIGLSFEGIKELNEANRWVVQALNLNPENTVALFTIVKLAYERNEFQDARQALLNYMTLNPTDTNMLYSLAGIEFKIGATDTAQQICEKILELDANDQKTKQLMEEISSSNNRVSSGSR